jgi:hypothetical protein
MERQVWICTECSKAILPEDTFILHTDWLSHLDCQRPHALSPEERVVLFHYCREHAVAECEQCAKGYRMSELGSDPVGAMDPLCPRCRKDLIGSVRAHLYNCSMLPLAVLQAARNAREVAQRLVERGRELSDTPDDLMCELEAALRVLREAAVQAPRGRSGA